MLNRNVSFSSDAKFLSRIIEWKKKYSKTKLLSTFRNNMYLVVELISYHKHALESSEKPILWKCQQEILNLTKKT